MASTGKTIARFGAVLLLSVPLFAHAEFLSLQGAEAGAYTPPAGMHLISSGVAGTVSGLSRERYQQYVGKAQVLGGQLTIYRDAAGVPKLVLGNQYPDLKPVTRVRLDPTGARTRVEDELGEAGAWKVQLMIDPANRRHFFRVENRRFDARAFYWVDAETGSVVNAYNGLTDAGIGIGVKGDTKDLTGLSTVDGSVFQLVSGNGRQSTYDARNRPRLTILGLLFPRFFLPGTLAIDADDTWDAPGSTSPGQAAMVDAQYYSRITDDYYLDVHGRDSLDDAGMPMVSTAHFGRGYCNAFWNGAQMVYGDGDGSTCIELSGGLDVVGHELTHGVTELTSNLIYQNESGALNEAFSDIMGSSIEFYADVNGLDSAATPDFLIGEDVILSPDDAPGFRNMGDPEEDADPDHYSERYLGSEDGGGVHTNSGIPNHAYYLLVNGGLNASCASPLDHDSAHCMPGDVPVAGIGLEAAEQIFYLTFTALPSNATMCQARLTSETVAALFPGTESSVSAAWEAVGVCP